MRFLFGIRTALVNTGFEMHYKVGGIDMANRQHEVYWMNVRGRSSMSDLASFTSFFLAQTTLRFSHILRC